METSLLGKSATDSVTHFYGVITARVTYLHGEPQLLLEGVDTTGRPIAQWVIESRARHEATIG